MVEIEFTCDEEYYGKIPEPIPASKFKPGWYKELENGEGEHNTWGNVQNCIPFFDAITTGWIIPVQTDMKVEARADDMRMRVDAELPEAAMGSRSDDVLGDVGLRKFDGFPIALSNLWRMNVPDGYSVMIRHPMNRGSKLFRTFDAIVDVDKYNATVNGSAMWLAGEWEGEIKAGTPMYHVMPFKRDSVITDGIIRSSTEEEAKFGENYAKMKRDGDGNYKTEYWTPKIGSRVVERED